MPHTILRSHTVFPVRVTSPAPVSRRQTSPIVWRSRPTQSNTWRTSRASSVALDDLGPLILGDHPLHLQEQVVFRTLAQGPVQEDDLHPRTPELIHQQHLIGIF